MTADGAKLERGREGLGHRDLHPRGRALTNAEETPNDRHHDHQLGDREVQESPLFRRGGDLRAQSRTA